MVREASRFAFTLCVYADSQDVRRGRLTYIREACRGIQVEAELEPYLRFIFLAIQSATGLALRLANSLDPFT